MDRDAVYWIWLSQIVGYSSPTVGQLLCAMMDAKTLYNSHPEQLLFNGVITKKQFDRMKNSDLSAAYAVLENCEKIGCSVVTPADSAFPEKLKEIYGMPSVLYVMGDINCLNRGLSVAMVGTRKPSPYGKQAADLIACELAGAGAVVVSGMAMGIDTCVHTGALKGGGKTVAVMGCGLHRAYPLQNATLMEIISRNGAVISEFAPNTPPERTNFPIRNRIISGCCDGVVVVEGERKSGSLITAGHALSQNRDVFALPGSIFDSRSTGPHWLISQGAKPVCGTADILEEYITRYHDTLFTKSANTNDGVEEIKLSTAPPIATQPQAVASPKKTKTKPPPPDYLNPLQCEIYALLEQTPITADTLTVKTSAQVKDVLACMTQLEIYALVDFLPGKGYVWRAT